MESIIQYYIFMAVAFAVAAVCLGLAEWLVKLFITGEVKWINQNSEDQPKP